MAIKIFIDQDYNPNGVRMVEDEFGMQEQDVVYNVGMYLANILKGDPRFEVLLSNPADYLINIQCNTNEDSEINGTEAYVYSNYTPSYYLAEQILAATVSRVGTRNNGLRIYPSLSMLQYIDKPSVLVKLGYLSNPSDNEKLKNNQWDFAYAIYNGLLVYFGFTI